MNAYQLVQYVNWTLFTLVFVLTVIRAVRHPRRVTIDTALLFASVALTVLINVPFMVQGLTPPPLLNNLRGAIFLTMPIFLLRLVDDFLGVPRWLYGLGLVMMALSVGGIFAIITTLILTFYFLVDAENLRAAFLRLFPVERRARAEAATREVVTKVSAWLGGQLLMGGIIGVSAGLVLWLMGIPYFSVLALISGIGELIPVLGPILSSIPAVIIAATVSYKLALFVMLFFVIQQQFESHVLVPKIMSRQVGVSPVVVIASLLIGGEVLGILGAILAVPSAAVLQVVLGELTSEDRGPTSGPRA